MYFFDPERGYGRRALVRDKAIGLLNDAQNDLDIMVNDFRNRSQGMLYEVKGNLNKEGISKLANKLRSDATPEVQNQNETTPGNGRMTPAVCLMVGSAGLLMMLNGLVRRSLFGGMLATTGASLIARSFYDVEHRFDPAMECKPVSQKQGSKSKSKAMAGKQSGEATMQ